MTGPDMGSGEVGRVVTPGYGTGKKSSGPRHDKPGVTKSPAPKMPAHPQQKGSGGKGRGGGRGR
jgi:hypothetical protein